ncbi:MAG: hypothetical protein CMN55_14080 [Sneathiella sp.]|jgi:hypothetical protein|uniref:hypothetical protein n=1 Tax=Sneathiella sp. TaxID=1964365 RepID=UPI000C5248ED|nr:hypothetical protein [Sneathiella sp.]MAL80211.1 hypothetical protein [Sneathiella sp.]
MKRFYRLAAAGAAFFMPVALLPLAAATAEGCLPRAELARQLAAQYGEVLIAQGLSSAGQLLEIYASPMGDSWSLTETDPAGRACLRAAGDYWNMPAALAGRRGGQPAFFQPDSKPDGGGAE